MIKAHIRGSVDCGRIAKAHRMDSTAENGFANIEYRCEESGLGRTSVVFRKNITEVFQRQAGMTLRLDVMPVPRRDECEACRRCNVVIRQ